MGNDGAEDLSLISHSGNIAWGKLCEVLHGRMIVIPDGTTEEEY